MVKWYLQKGKIKLKEIYQMEVNYGRKSIKPLNLSVYYSGIDFSRVNVWQLFKRLLPKQIAISCKQKSKSISELAIELGVASCYLEEEMNILVDVGIIMNNGKDRFQTNFLIINKEDSDEIKKAYDELYKDYIIIVENVFNKNLDKLKKTNMFKYNADENRYRWIFGDQIVDFDSRILLVSDDEYPRILSCGARAFIFGEENRGSKFGTDQTPTIVDDYKLWAKDSVALGTHWKNQEILKNKKYAKIIVDVYNGIIDDNLKEDYAFLLKEEYLININGKIYANVPYLGKEFNALMKEIYKDLYDVLKDKSLEIYNKIENIVKNTLPSSLKEYVHGYTFTLSKFYSGIYFMQYQVESGFCKLNKNRSDTIALNYFTDN